MAGLAPKRVITAQQGSCVRFLPLLRPPFLRRGPNSANCTGIFVLCTANGSPALLNPGVRFFSSFPEQCARNCLLGACLCQVHVCLRRLRAVYGLLHQQPPWKLLVQKPQLYPNSSIFRCYLLSFYYMYSCGLLLTQAKHRVSYKEV